MGRKQSNWKRYGPVAGGLGAIVLVGSAVYAFIASTGGVQAPQQPDVQQISLVMPPPPPPPPPELEPPPEPEMEEVEVPEPEPEPVEQAESDEPPPGEDLGLDADGVAGSDAFGLKARKGGRGLIGGGDINKWYASLVQRDLQSALAAEDEVRRGRYTVVLKIWLAADGRIEDSELVQGSGDPDIDQALTATLSGGVRISRAPPEDLPQPIRLRISSRT
jgi:periplasmic protein TonB